MIKIIISIILIILVITPSFNQCNYKTKDRPDGNVIKYFNPKTVII